ncbi:hypothetical protein [Desulfosporosinus metallidurans]|uniref:Terminase n=1 Tax=Desulfosporosinus metallidurans TaxID=1888891 RepID=A0A1Q8QJV4_9FIRM|nr:hypothetical protein [Desulfosporosinus metallidurans]OLN27538.1 hypothetical protein DSOL_4510 [Desulfosporosinus metallidurans]
MAKQTITPMTPPPLQSDEQDRQLLYEYIFKQFIASGATPIEATTSTENLMIKHSSNLFGIDGLAHYIGSLSIPFFCKYFLQDTFVPSPTNVARELSDIHIEIWEELDNMFLKDEYDKIEVIWPRGCAKTTIVDFALSVWLHAYKKSTYTLVCGRTESDATEFLAQTRQAFEENVYILQAFGALVQPSKFIVNKLELELANKTKIQAFSSTSSMRGKKYNGNRPNVIIADDFQGKSDVITQESRDKKYNTFIEDSGYAGDKAVFRKKVKIKQATKFIVCGTILHRDCFMSRLLLNKDYKRIIKRVVDFDVDEYFHEGLWEEFRLIYFDSKLQDSASHAKEFFYQNESQMKFATIWEDKFDPLDLALDYYNNPSAFKQEMMNDASKIGDKWFKSNRTESPSEIESHTFTKTMLCVDPASTDTTKSDSFGFLVGSMADNGFKYVRKAELLKIDARTAFDKYIQHIVDLLMNYPDISTVYIEKNTFNGSDANRLEEFIGKIPMLRARNVVILC